MSASPLDEAAVSPDRDSDVPLWAQVRADVLRRCRDGAFAGGMPGEMAMCIEYGVSRHTLREALRSLRDSGSIRSQRGRGSVVTSMHVEATTEVMEVGQSIDATAAALLGLAVDAPLTTIRSVVRQGEIVIAVETRWLADTDAPASSSSGVMDRA